MGHFFEARNDKLAARLKDPFVFHVSLKDFQREKSPWTAIGSRMLLQRPQNDETGLGRISVNDIYAGWYPPAPTQIIKVLATEHPERKTVVLIVDDLQKIGEALGEYQMWQTLMLLKDLAQYDFILVCVTSTIYSRLGPGQLAIRLPCNPPMSPDS